MGLDNVHEKVFIVRMWPAHVADRQKWRGSVQHVSSGRKLYVSGLADIVEFITAELSASRTDDHPAK
jgi:hypothetical protein